MSGDAAPRRRQLAGPGAIEAALAAGEPVRLVLVRRDATGAALGALAARARAAGVPLRRASERELWRLCARREPCDALALVGSPPGGALADVLADGGAVWLLAGVAYAANAGAALRTAEVSGASGVVIDAPGFDHLARRRALRVAMRADLFLPVCFAPGAPAVAEARRRGFRVIGIEDSGTRAPWQVDLRGPVVLVAGGEERGVPPDLLEACDTVVRLPMAGFIPSYNLQSAVAAVALERLRQTEGTG